MLRLLARLMKGLKIGAESSHAQSRDVLGHIKPVRSNISHTTRRTTGLCVDTPVPVRVVQQPVLRMSALQDENLTQIAVFAQAAHLLHHGVITQIVTNAVAHSLPGGERDEFLRLRHGCGQRLLTNYVLAGLERILRHEEVLRIGRTDVDCIDRGIAKDIAVASHCRNGESGAQASCRFFVSACNRSGFHKSHSPNCFEMYTAHKAGAENCRSDCFHPKFPSVSY